jgi:hypothetical protein
VGELPTAASVSNEGSITQYVDDGELRGEEPPSKVLARWLSTYTATTLVCWSSADVSTAAAIASALSYRSSSTALVRTAASLLANDAAL